MEPKGLLIRNVPSPSNAYVLITIMWPLICTKNRKSTLIDYIFPRAFTIEKTKRKTKNNISTSDTDTIKGETLSNIRGRNDRSKIQRKVASNRPAGPKLFSV